MRCDLRFLLSQYELFNSPSCTPAAETLTLERTPSDLVDRAYALAPAENELMANRPAPAAHPAACNVISQLCRNKTLSCGPESARTPTDESWSLTLASPSSLARTTRGPRRYPWTSGPPRPARHRRSASAAAPGARGGIAGNLLSRWAQPGLPQPQQQANPRGPPRFAFSPQSYYSESK